MLTIGPSQILLVDELVSLVPVMLLRDMMVGKYSEMLFVGLFVRGFRLINNYMLTRLTLTSFLVILEVRHAFVFDLVVHSPIVLELHWFSSDLLFLVEYTSYFSFGFYKLSTHFL